MDTPLNCITTTVVQFNEILSKNVDNDPKVQCDCVTTLFVFSVLCCTGPFQDHIKLLNYYQLECSPVIGSMKTIIQSNSMVVTF